MVEPTWQWVVLTGSPYLELKVTVMALENSAQKPREGVLRAARGSRSGRGPGILQSGKTRRLARKEEGTRQGKRQMDLHGPPTCRPS